MLRKELNLTQQEFAKRISTSRNNIAGYEANTRSPSEAVIALICRTFHVNEEWLRHGNGNMFRPQNNNAFDLLREQYNMTSLEERILRAYFAIDASHRYIVADFVQTISKCIQIESPPPSPVSHDIIQQEPTIDEKVAAYRTELEAEEKEKAKSAASPNGKENIQLA